MNELSTICAHFGSCSGCVLSTDMSAPPIWQDVKKFFAEQGVFPHLEVGALVHWRIKSKLAIRGTFENPLIGLFRAGTHEVQPISSCQSHHKAINRAVLTVKKAVFQEKISVYQEQTSLGLLRYMQCLVDPVTERVQLVLVAQCDDPSLDRLIQRLLAQPELWHSIWLNVQSRSTNEIFGGQWIQKYGDPFLFLLLEKRSFPFHPGAFTQAHWTLFEKLTDYVVKQIPLGADLLEIYAGVGVMGILAAARCSQVQLVENNPFSYCSFKQIPKLANVHYHLKEATEAIPYLLNSNCVLLDPPRKGVDPLLLQAMALWSGKIIYVSCDFRKFKRDADILIQSGWVLKQAKGYLLFPGTNHVEIVAVLEKPRRA